MTHLDAEFFKAVAPWDRLLICIKGSPDPDVLASAFVCRQLLEKSGKSCRIVATQRLALHQNRVFARQLSLPFELADDFIQAARWAQAYLVLDHASPMVEGVSDKLPCAVHIDHHEAPDVSFPVALSWCRADVGATSTLVAQILASRVPSAIKHPWPRTPARTGSVRFASGGPATRAAGARTRLPYTFLRKRSSSATERTPYPALAVTSRDMRRMATALLFGIQTDTDHGVLATDRDYAAIEFLSHYADARLLRKLSSVPLSRSVGARMRRSERAQVRYRDWLFVGAGFVPERARDDIAIMADQLLRKEKPILVVVFALVHNDRIRKLTLDASVRSSDPKLRLSPLIRRIAVDGGGRRHKGAFQVKLDYFWSYSDRDALWELVERATLERLKRMRDEHYKVKIQGLWDAVLRRGKPDARETRQAHEVLSFRGLWRAVRRGASRGVRSTGAQTLAHGVFRRAASGLGGTRTALRELLSLRRRQG